MSTTPIPLRLYAVVSGTEIEIATATVDAQITIEAKPDGTFLTTFDVEQFLADLGRLVEVDRSGLGLKRNP